MASNDIPLPKAPVLNKGNVAKNWNLFELRLTRYLKATEKINKSDEVKTNLLLTCLDDFGCELYSNFTFQSEEERNNYDVVIKKFEEHCNPKKNVTASRYKFLTARQKDGETVDEFVNRLQTLSKDCEFDIVPDKETLRESLIKDVLIIGTNDVHLQEKLLATKEVTLESAVEAGRSAEQSKENVQMLQGDMKSVNLTQKEKTQKKDTS